MKKLCWVRFWFGVCFYWRLVWRPTSCSLCCACLEGLAHILVETGVATSDILWCSGFYWSLTLYWSGSSMFLTDTESNYCLAADVLT